MAKVSRSRDVALLREALAEETYETEAALLLRAALPRRAYLLRPFPPSLEAQPANLAGALDWMRANGLAHGTARDPNLTPKGVAIAERLLEADAAAAAVPAAAE